MRSLIIPCIELLGCVQSLVCMKALVRSCSPRLWTLSLQSLTLMGIVNQMQLTGDSFPDHKVVKKAIVCFCASEVWGKNLYYWRVTWPPDSFNNKTDSQIECSGAKGHYKECWCVWWTFQATQKDFKKLFENKNYTGKLGTSYKKTIFPRCQIVRKQIMLGKIVGLSTNQHSSVIFVTRLVTQKFCRLE